MEIEHITRTKFRKPPRLSERGGEIVRLARRWIGTPYVHQANVKGAGCDCLGLLRGVWRELHGDDAEVPPAYSPDWAEATGRDTLYRALLRHMTEIEPGALSPGDVALFRMGNIGPAKHCGIVADLVLPSEPDAYPEERRLLTLIHARQGRRVAEEKFEPFWRARLAHAFRL